MTGEDFKALVARSFREPRAAARALLSLDWPIAARWQLLALALVLGMGLVQISLFLTPEGRQAMAEDRAPGLVLLGVIQAVALVGTVVVVHMVARFLGGARPFEDAVMVVGWLQAVMLLVQAAQIALLLVLPGVSALVGMLSFALLMWMMTGFVAELAGSPTLARVFFALLLGLVALVVVLAFLLVPLGLTGALIL
ncbi:MAG: YIP1 family protein [Paracoccaceae bacterium]